jgi:hypothetical protein
MQQILPVLQRPDTELALFGQSLTERIGLSGWRRNNLCSILLLIFDFRRLELKETLVLSMFSVFMAHVFMILVAM